MMVKIRLQRFGTTKRPFYRIVAAEARKKRDGRYLEIVGVYDPTKQPALIEIDSEKALKWLGNGAQPTDTVRNLFTKTGINKQFIESKKTK
ncbi:MAG: 30S ribosomal protein S16 [Bacilli bacterium]|nr:30S ribosomal protein S16 [Bacilli bacterium]MBN2696960.1 30S ribosomal protein S16 [Bacilli bacterium]